MIIRRTVPIVVATAILATLPSAALPSATLASSQPGLVFEPQPPPSGLNALIAKADKEGTVRIIVQTTDMDRQANLSKSLDQSQSNYQIRNLYKRFPLISMNADSATIKTLSADHGVVRVVEDIPDTASAETASAEGSGLAETIPLIKADIVHARGGTGAKQTIVVLDTGVDRGHPFLKGRVVDEACYSGGGDASARSLCPNGAASQTGRGAADALTAACANGTGNLCFHGTHVAGIAAGSKVPEAPADGVAPGADVVAIQVFSRSDDSSLCGAANTPCLLSYLSDQLLGLQKALDLSEKRTIAAVNMSLGSSTTTTSACDDDLRKLAIDSLLAKGTATVIAAGNSGATGVGTPGCISSAVTVGATDDNDMVATFSNRGPQLDLFAPGVNVKSAMPGGGYQNLSGTSMAAPMVTGSFAVLKQARPNAGVPNLLGALQSTGTSIVNATGLIGGRVNQGYTWSTSGDFTSMATATSTSRINLLGAWDAVKNGPLNLRAKISQ